MAEISFVIVTFALISFWWHSDKQKSHALRIVANYCAGHELQLLDQTLVLRGLWLARDLNQRLQLRRKYEFEFSSTGAHRYGGEIKILGGQIESIKVDVYQSPDSSLQ